ncbi:MAG: TRAP transporter large permease [Rhizobiaceae bacterium]|nr:TRAP transporter large permease [Rhizobiaceae bacterium]
MSPTILGLLSIALLLVLMAQRMPVAFAMIAAGLCGLTLMSGWKVALATFVSEAWTTATYYELVVIPLFVLMGNLAGAAGLSRDLYAAAYAVVGGLRGGLAHATVLGCTGFSALSGSSVASALTLGRVALPEMKRYGYDPRIGAGAVAAGGTLGILIPPSTGFVLYAILTQESIGRLFLAGVLPGLMLCALFMLVVLFVSYMRPEFCPPGETFSHREKLRAAGRSVPVIAIILVTIGGMYGGVFTPVEAAGVGAGLALLAAIPRKEFTIKRAVSAVTDTINTTVMIYFIIIGANVFAPVLSLTQIPQDLAGMLSDSQIGGFTLLLLVLLVFIFLGMFLDGFAMMVILLPIVLPIIEASSVPELLGLPADSSNLTIWFGVVMVIVLEMALISPPVGMNVFVVKNVARDLSMKQIYAGIVPFWFAMFFALGLLVAFPSIALVLPNSMIN